MSRNVKLQRKELPSFDNNILSDMAAVDRVRTADPVDGRCGGQRRLDPQTP